RRRPRSARLSSGRRSVRIRVLLSERDGGTETRMAFQERSCARMAVAASGIREQKGAAAMMDVALFGAGRIGKIHAGNVVRQPGANLKYVVDVDASAAAALAEQHSAQVASADA